MRKEFLPLTSLSLSEENPRLDIFDSNQDILHEMVKNQSNKIYVLAEDILNYGLSPIDSIAVYPVDNGKFAVAEGNRRLTALMLLNNPTLIETLDRKMYQRFVDLIRNSKNTPPKEIECVIFDSWDNHGLQHWILVRHLGLNKGKGIDGWNPLQKERYEQKMLGVSALLDFWKELTEKDILNPHQIKSISKTNWERILNKKGREYLNILKKKDEYIIPSDISLFKLKLQKIAEKLANQSVGVVYDNEKIQEFLDEVENELFGDKLPSEFTDEKWTNNFQSLFDNTYNTNVDDSSLSNFEEPLDTKSRSFQDDSDSQRNKSKLPRDTFLNNRTIIPSNYPLRSSNTRINKLIQELKKLEVDEYPNACGALCRVLFELSAKHYLEVNELVENVEQENFIPAITKASNDLRSKGKLTNSEHSLISKDKETIKNMFNGHMHSISTYPSTIAIKDIFKSHRKFIGLCLEK